MRYRYAHHKIKPEPMDLENPLARLKQALARRQTVDVIKQLSEAEQATDELGKITENEGELIRKGIMNCLNKLRNEEKEQSEDFNSESSSAKLDNKNHLVYPDIKNAKSKNKASCPIRSITKLLNDIWVKDHVGDHKDDFLNSIIQILKIQGD